MSNPFDYENLSRESKDNLERHQQLSHAMQSGVKYDQELGSQDGTPKHLRVGINVALRDAASLARLLIEKGVITTEEYTQAIADGMQEEVEKYEAKLELKMGIKVTLH